VLAVALLVSVNVSTGSTWSWIAAVVAAVALLAGLFAISRDREGWAFIGTFVAIGAAVATLFLALVPDVMPSSTNPAFSLTTTNASSTELTLTIMTWVAAIFTPIVLIYTSWTYWTFRRRIGTQHIPAAAAGTVGTKL
jgi:cytochrome d ubiquinol oxidase subunit II